MFFFFLFFSHLNSFQDYKFHCIKYHSNMRPDVFMFTTHSFGIACQNKVSLGKFGCECFHTSGLQCLCQSCLFKTMYF